MPIDQHALEQALPEIEAFLRLPFPDLPEGEGIGECVMDLLLLEPQIADDFTSAINRRPEVIDFTIFLILLKRVSETENRFKRVSVAIEEEMIKSHFISYVGALRRAGEALYRVQSKPESTA